MRVVFLGTGDIGLPTLRMLINEPRHEVAAVVTQPDKPVGRHQELRPPAVKVLAQDCRIPVFQPAKIRAPDAIEEFRALRPEVAIVMAYGQFLPGAVLEAPSMACLNLHASLLPRHRGAAPIQSAIEAGDRESGVTVMYVSKELDAGDILSKKALPIRRRETAGTLHDRIAQLGPEALCEALDLLEQGRAPRIPQDPAEATYAGKLDRENGVIDWTAGACAIDRKVRAMNPWPAAFTFVPGRDGTRRTLKIFSMILHRKISGSPGEVLRADSRGLLVGAGDGAVLLREVQLEGKKRMRAGDFLVGNRIEPGTILGRG